MIKIFLERKTGLKIMHCKNLCFQINSAFIRLQKLRALKHKFAFKVTYFIKPQILQEDRMKKRFQGERKNGIKMGLCNQKFIIEEQHGSLYLQKFKNLIESQQQKIDIDTVLKIQFISNILRK